MSGPVRTVTALKRWSCSDRQLPPVDAINAIHVYDFDNTLFASPIPNKQLWSGPTCGQLQGIDFLHGGGWWHNPSLLTATGQGIDIEEPRAWEGFWNEQIVELVRLSIESDDTLTVLLTGRAEPGFSDLIQRMLRAKGLGCDMVCLKPNVSPTGERFNSTMDFKQALLRDIAFTYAGAAEIRMYEDRPKHTAAFRDFFAQFNQTLLSTQPPPRQPITAEVIQVSEADILMDQATEIAEVQRMINVHNTAILNDTGPANLIPYKIKKSVLLTGYLISPEDRERLTTLVPQSSRSDCRILASNILIAPRPATHAMLEKAGGMNAHQRWRVTGVGSFDGRVWAARVEPTNAGAKVFTFDSPMYVVLATRMAKPVDANKIRSWQPVSQQQAFEFDTTVGEKVNLRIEEEIAGEDEYEASFPNAGKKARKHPREEDFPALGSSAKKGGDGGQKQHFNQPQQHRQSGNNAWNGQNNNNRGGGGNQRGGGGGNRGRGGQGFRGGGGRGGGRGGGQRGRGGGRGGYRSLDANVGQGSYGGGSMEY